MIAKEIYNDLTLLCSALSKRICDFTDKLLLIIIIVLNNQNEILNGTEKLCF